MVEWFKTLLKKNFTGFVFFFRELRYRVFIAVFLSISIGVLDGLGLTMFLPLLQMADGEEAIDSEALGRLDIVVNTIEGWGVNMNLVNVLIIMVAFFFFKGFAKFANNTYRILIRQRFIRQLRLKMLHTFNRIKYKYFVMSDIGRIQNTMGGEVERVSRAFQDYFRTIEQGILVTVYVGFAFFIDAQFALFVIIGGGLTNFLYNYVYKFTKGASRKFTTYSHIYQGKIIQYVANYKYLKATSLLRTYAKQMEASIYDIEQSRKKIGMLRAVLDSAREPLMILVVAAVILIQTKVLEVPLGPILISLIFFYRALTVLVGMQNSWNRYLEMLGSVENVIDFTEEIKRNKAENGNEEFEEFRHEISLRNASFAYKDTVVLQDINLAIQKKETIAFVGESGSGKTTLVNILAGLLPLENGTFTIDGRDAKSLDVKTYQKRIGYITQEPVIFSDTIYNNVSFWERESAESQQRFQYAVEQSAISDFLVDLPEGQETLLGNNGVNVSGGQKQRISIARELYKDIDILIMDEATSALDSETERAIQESIDNLKGKLTIIMVAHRLSTIIAADRIVVMKNGRIEQVGSYEELMKTSTVFQRMVDLQEI